MQFSYPKRYNINNIFFILILILMLMFIILIIKNKEKNIYSIYIMNLS